MLRSSVLTSSHVAVVCIGSVNLARRYHVGDTPMDLQAAEGAGAQGIGVTTGIFTREELKAVSPGVPAAVPRYRHAIMTIFVGSI
jgi:histidinol phosphatase-like enzyme